jgi:phenylpropionate dioxygenase-like ring-hydroxylating dioxygenase large terminal subunit
MTARYVRNCWYVAAWSHEVHGDKLFARTMLGEAVLLYRASDGSPIALADRCCHRHAPLSLGRKEGDCVRCMYHGLLYDRRGRCVEIPGQSSVPSRLQLRCYPTAERGRWIFLWMGNPNDADASLLPDVSALDHPEWRSKPGYMHYKANYLVISDNLLDFSHLSYVHERTLGGTRAIAEARPKIVKVARGLRVTRRVENTAPAPYHEQFGRFTGTVDRYWIYDYLIPGILLLDSGVTPSEGSKEGGRTLKFRSCQALTPESETTTHYFFMQAQSFALDDESVTEALYQSVVMAFDEDRQMIEAQQKMIDSAPPSEMVVLPFDVGLVQFRRAVENAIEGESSIHSHPDPLPLNSTTPG